jgi:hypothetical protein
MSDDTTGHGAAVDAGAVADPFAARWNWRGGALAGLLATAAMGLAITAMNLSTLRVAIAGLYGQEGNLVVGWLAHLLHGTLFGLLFAALLADPGLYRVEASVWKSTAAGVLYGVVLAVAGAGIIMPIWLSLAGVSNPPTAPFVTLPTLVWHLVYGVVLGGVFPFTRGLRPVEVQ